MALPVFQRTIVTEAGDVIAGAEVEVVLESTGLAADIFSNRDGSTPLTNPFFTGADGFAKFFAAPDEYRITATGPTGSIVFRFVVLTGDIARQNANAVSITGGSANLAVNGLTVGTDQLVTSGGNVGIGTSSPNTKLEVFGGAIQGILNSGQGGQFTSGAISGVSNGFAIDITSGNAQTYTFHNGATQSVRITSSGNVGIGTTSPAKKLDVTGAIRASTGILFGSDTANANTLDDYEEGSWTPTDASGAGLTLGNTSNNCFYIKIGSIVVIGGRFSLPTTANTDLAIIGGLPFVSKGTTSSLYGGSYTLTSDVNARAFLVRAGLASCFIAGFGLDFRTNAECSGQNYHFVATYHT